MRIFLFFFIAIQSFTQVDLLFAGELEHPDSWLFTHLEREDLEREVFNNQLCHRDKVRFLACLHAMQVAYSEMVKIPVVFLPVGQELTVSFKSFYLTPLLYEGEGQFSLRAFSIVKREGLNQGLLEKEILILRREAYRLWFNQSKESKKMAFDFSAWINFLIEKFPVGTERKDFIGKTMNAMLAATVDQFTKITPKKGIIRFSRETTAQKQREISGVLLKSSDAKDYLYLKIATFTLPGLCQRVQSFLKHVKSSGHILIDLRGNGGGLVSEAECLSALFLEKGTILYLGHSLMDQGIVSKTTMSKPLVPSRVPVTILVDEGSASASEIFASILRYHNRAMIVGVRTYGKGSMMIRSEKANAAEVGLTLTTYIFSLPDLRTHHFFGLTPDIEIKGLTEKEDILRYADYSLFVANQTTHLPFPMAPIDPKPLSQLMQNCLKTMKFSSHFQLPLTGSEINTEEIFVKQGLEVLSCM
jgi:hypothetical protein